MIIQGTITKAGRWWAIAIPALEIFTQARTKADVPAMAVDALNALAGRSLGASAQLDRNRLLIQADDTAALVALVLRQKRSRAGLTLQQMARRLGSNSPNTYARYEQGTAMPSVAVLDRLLRAVDGRGLILG